MDILFSTFLIAFSSFLPVLNPFGGAMYLFGITPDIDDRDRGMMVRRIVIFSAITLLVSLFAGHLILRFFGISVDILRLCGGIILFAAGWSALNAPANMEAPTPDTPKKKYSRPKLISMAFYPMTLPITMGPGAISVACAFGAGIFHQGVFAFAGLMLACAANLLIVYLCFRYCDRFSRKVGIAGADAISRIFAFILVCIGASVSWRGLTALIDAWNLPGLTN